MNDSDFMRRAIELALLGKGFTNPNPLVGAVIVRDDGNGGSIVAEGFHHKCGDLHAERDALKNARENNVDVRGCTIFVTLEPCCHFGRQPPCTDAIIESGIKKVVIGSRDPNPLVNGKGRRILEEHGIEVVEDFLRDECDRINPVFFHFIKSKMPYVTVKYAMTADGETACSSGLSKWVTGEKARENVHLLRAQVMAVMTGIGTVKADDPLLNVRLNRPVRQPARVVLDSRLEISPDCNLVKSALREDCGKVFVFCGVCSSEEMKSKRLLLEKLGVSVFDFSDCGICEDDVPDGVLRAQLKKLGSLGFDSVLVESGGRLNAGLFFEGCCEDGSPLVQEVHAYIAPKIFGNDGSVIFSPVRGLGALKVEDCVKLSRPEIEVFGDDVLLKYKVLA